MLALTRAADRRMGPTGVDGPLDACGDVLERVPRHLLVPDELPFASLFDLCTDPGRRCKRDAIAGRPGVIAISEPRCLVLVQEEPGVVGVQTVLRISVQPGCRTAAMCG